MNLYDDIKFVKGVGPKMEEQLNKCGIFTVLDLLLYFPRTYEYIRGNIEVDDISEDEKNILTCRVRSIGKPYRTRTGKSIVTINFSYGDNIVVGKWFNTPYVTKSFLLGQEYNLCGKFKKVKGSLEITNPQIAKIESIKNEILPIYHLKGNMSNKFISKIINYVLDNVKIEENIPNDVVSKYKMCSLDNAIREIHFPSQKYSLNKAIERLKFQELFNYSLKILTLKSERSINNKGISFKISDDLVKLKESLPFQLTNAQNRVMREILIDEKRETPMNRLVQGDVGSGKTVIALIAMFNVYKNGYQTVLMAPTEILAIQHYEEAKKLLSSFDVDIELLTGSTSKKEKERIKSKISSGKEIMVIGTHALIQDDVNFTNLGLSVTDEQHRFGVEQRCKLSSNNSDILVMTATPIPRTLALYMYCDLDISAIDELPPGRKVIKTMCFEEKSSDSAYELILEELKKGRQSYIVCPLIEEAEGGEGSNDLNSVASVYDELSSGIFKNYNVAMMHGKLKPSEKEDIIKRFKDKEIDVLISTTVIEVGVNVPNATCMVIENAERFGLAQLHQLRGRVGRGEYQSYCILIAKIKSEITKKRMDTMVKSNDGFYISEQDFKLRGTGEMFGFKQSGDNELMLADFIDDINILKAAFREAEAIIKDTTKETRILRESIERSIEKTKKFICFN